MQALLEFANPTVMGKVARRTRDAVPVLTGMSYDEWFDWLDSELSEGEPKYERPVAAPSGALRKLREDLLGVLNRLRDVRQMEPAPAQWVEIAERDRDAALACQAVLDRWDFKRVEGSSNLTPAASEIQFLLRGLRVLMDSWWKGEACLPVECKRCGKFVVRYLNYRQTIFCSDPCAKAYYNEKRPRSST